MLPTSVTRMGHLATFDSPTVHKHQYRALLYRAPAQSTRALCTALLYRAPVQSTADYIGAIPVFDYITLNLQHVIKWNRDVRKCIKNLTVTQIKWTRRPHYFEWMFAKATECLGLLQIGLWFCKFLILKASWFGWRAFMIYGETKELHNVELRSVFILLNLNHSKCLHYWKSASIHSKGQLAINLSIDIPGSLL